MINPYDDQDPCVKDIKAIAAQSEYGGLWTTQAGMFHVSKDGKISPAFTNELKEFKEKQDET